MNEMYTVGIINENNGSIIRLRQPRDSLTKEDKYDLAYFLADLVCRDLLYQKNMDKLKETSP